MSKQLMAQQAHIVGLDDEALLKFVGALYENAKALDEQMKADPEVERLEAELREYKATNYTDAIRTYKAQLKAARVLAKARGLRFVFPEIK